MYLCLIFAAYLSTRPMHTNCSSISLVPKGFSLQYALPYIKYHKILFTLYKKNSNTSSSLFLTQKSMLPKPNLPRILLKKVDIIDHPIMSLSDTYGGSGAKDIGLQKHHLSKAMSKEGLFTNLPPFFHTVDGQNPAPPGMVKTLLMMGYDHHPWWCRILSINSSKTSL